MNYSIGHNTLIKGPSVDGITDEGEKVQVNIQTQPQGEVLYVSINGVTIHRLKSTQSKIHLTDERPDVRKKLESSLTRTWDMLQKKKIPSFVTHNDCQNLFTEFLISTYQLSRLKTFRLVRESSEFILELDCLDPIYPPLVDYILEQQS